MTVPDGPGTIAAMNALEGEDPEPVTTNLAERARVGDLSRFEELYARLAPTLLGWASLRIRKELHGRVDPEEIVQETWYRALQSLSEYDRGRAPFREWVFGHARNVLLEALRKVHRAGPSAPATPSSLFPLEHHPDSVTSFTRRLARDEGLQRFLARILELGEEEQTLTILCGLEGLGCDQAAERLGISHEAALKRWQRLRAEIATRGLSRYLVD